MEVLWQPDRVIVGGLLVTLLAFGVREVARGELRAAGQDLWRSCRRRRRKAREQGEELDASC